MHNGDTADAAPHTNRVERPEGTKERVNNVTTGSNASCECPKVGRKLVICIDGTSNQFNDRNTNVVELYGRLMKNDDQLTFYNSGIGTYATPSWRSLSYWNQVFTNKVDLAIAWRFERILLSAYKWMSENYREGDRIFLFGFSRGAYQVRALSAMIDKVGLIHKGNEDQIPFAYQLYAAINKKMQKPGMCERFKKTFSREVKVHFVGVWDTVSSVGIVRNDKNLPGTTDGMGHVCIFRHALALDEKRVKFLPEYVCGGDGPSGGTKGGNVKEVWFAGSHSDIGGGSTTNLDLDKFGPALRWMTYEAILAGLDMDPLRGEWEKLIEPHNSMTAFWRIVECLPIKRLTYKGRDKKGRDKTTHWPHICAPRAIKNGQKIHESVFERIESKPQTNKRRGTRLPPLYSWDRQEVLESMIEADPYASVGVVLGRLEHDGNLIEADIGALNSFALQADGVRSLQETPGAVDTLISSLKKVKDNESLNDGVRQDIANAIVNVLLACTSDDSDHKRHPVSEIRLLADMLITNPERPKQRETAHQLLKRLTTRLPLKGHNYDVYSVAFPPDGKIIASGSGDDTIRIWDASNGEQMGGPLRGHTDDVYTIAFSPDGKFLASGSGDHTIRLWDMEKRQQMGEPFKGHTNIVSSVAFSPDGKTIASGSWDDTIRLWDVDSGEQVDEPLRGAGTVYTIAFSPDGKVLASGSYDRTIRLWNIESREQVGKPFEGHTEMVMSVFFSPDGKTIASGSCDDTIRLWNVESGAQVGEPLRGHTGDVNTVAFSPDGKMLASGSDDRTIRLWDMEKKQQVGEPFKGHTDQVWSVAFSPDGKMIASGSFDGTIRLWDATGDWMRLTDELAAV